MYLINNEGKFVVAGRIIRALKTKIYKYLTSLSKNVYIDKLDVIFNKHNNTCHSTIKMKPVDGKDNTCIVSDKESNNKYPKLRVGDRVKISKHNIFVKDYSPNWSEEIFLITILFHRHEDIIGMF